MRGVRLSLEVGWEGQCDTCRQWWPLDEESWVPRQGMRRCRACLNEERKLYLRDLRASNPEMRERHRRASRENQRAKRVIDHNPYLEYQRRWYAENHVRLNAERAERYLIQCELDGVTPRRSNREETPETIAIRAEFRKRWEADHGLVRRHPVPLEERKAQRREYNRQWMARRRAMERAA